MIRGNLTNFERRLISGSENIHREDLTSVERENLIQDLWEEGKKEGVIETQEDLAENLGVDRKTVSLSLAASKFRKKYSLSPEISTRAIVDTAGLPEEERVKILKKHEKGLVEAASIRRYTRAVKIKIPLRSSRCGFKFRKPFLPSLLLARFNLPHFNIFLKPM